MDIVVVGVATQQLSLPVEEFPLDFNPRRYLPGGISVEVGGAGYTVARHSARLGHSAYLVAPIGEDLAASTIDLTAERDRVNTALCLRELRRTPRSVLLVDEGGRRSAFSDLLGVTEADVDNSAVRSALAAADVAVLGNLDLSRPLIPVVCDAGVPLAVDLQDLRDPSEPELTDFHRADVLTMANTYLVGYESHALVELRRRGAEGFLVITQGSQGLLALAPGADEPVHVPASPVRHVTTTEGAGDVFLAELVHARYVDGHEPIEAARQAVEATSRHLGSAESVASRMFRQKGEMESLTDPQELARHLGRPWVTGGW